MDKNNRTIARNTVFLYIRMIVLIAVNFYTTRVVLDALGIDDYGLYGVVAGFVAMVTFINHSMTSSVQRFLNYEIGKGDFKSINDCFGSSLLVQWLLIAILFILAETVGLWFVNHELKIPSGQLIAANVVYQTSVLTVLISIYRSSFNAIIIARERMSFYAVISLLEGLLQLAVAYIVLIISQNRLAVYGALLLIVSIIVSLAYIIYARKIMPGLTMKPRYDKADLKELASFCGWNILGAGSGVLKSQGINVLMNLFFGVAVNAACGVATQVLNCIFRLASNFQVAMYPQIVQSYAQEDRPRYLMLCYGCFKVSVYLMWILTLPLLICTPYVLGLWLGDNVPEYTVIFVRIILLTGLVDSLGSAISTPIYATGQIRKYQMYVSGIILMVLPISWVLYKLGYAPATSLYVALVLSILAQYVRVRIWCDLVGISGKGYFTEIVLPASVIIAISFFISYAVSLFIPPLTFVGLIVICGLTFLINVGAIYTIGLKKNERKTVVSVAKKYLRIKYR